MAGSEGVGHTQGNIIREFERLRKRSSSTSDGRLHWTKDAELIELEQEYNRLVKRKESLTKKVAEKSLMDQLQCYVEQHTEGELASLGELANEDNLFKAIELVKKKQLMETFNVYRLTGLSFVLLDGNRVRFCLDTFYKGKFFGPYYIEVQVKDEKFKILKHTIPIFVPLEEIRKKYESSTDIKELLSIVSGYLKAFVSRRQRCAAIKEKHEDFSVENFYAALAYDFVKFTIKFSSERLPDFEVKLKYNDLNDTLPKIVDLKCSDEDAPDILIDDLRANLLVSLEIRQAILKMLE